MKKRFHLFVFLLILLCFSCRAERQSGSAPQETDASVFGQLLNDSNNSLDFANPEKLEYNYSSVLEIAPNLSLEIEYSFSFPPSSDIKENYTLTLTTETDSWTLPMDFLFLGVPVTNEAVFHYAIPLKDRFNGKFNITLVAEAPRSETQPMPSLKIRSIRFMDQWFGFIRAENGYFASPYVSKQNNGDFVIDLPNAPGNNQSFELIAELSEGASAAAETDRRRFTAAPETGKIPIPSVLISRNSPVILTGDRIASFRLSPQGIPAFPVPIKTDPGLVLDWPVDRWRNRGWEIFQWEQFPSILMVDTADYQVQDRLFKRLAFFVEKAGFRGRLMHDDEFAELHGWNAHDYPAEDLARFFDAAQKANFPLNDEELVLKRILLNEGLIHQSGGNIISGSGGIISISRQSITAMRRIYMAHEGFHGLYFIDKDFRDFTRSRWEQFNPQARQFFLAYMDFKDYDTADELLVLKEFKGHILQMTMPQVSPYFGIILPGFLENTEFQNALPPKDNTGSWPSLSSVFTAEAQVLSAYVNRRWGLDTGRVWALTVAPLN